jgi:two-component system LytT family response regulator
MPSTGEYPLRLVDFDVAEQPAPAAAPHSENESLRPLLEEVLAELKSAKRKSERVVVRTNGKVVFLRAEEISWVEAAGNYVNLHAGAESYVLRESMKNMETRLDPELFVRIHRSAIVNVNRIRELQPWFHGEYVVILHDGTRLMASRVFSDRLDKLIA